jgi:hypothetical protein
MLDALNANAKLVGDNHPFVGDETGADWHGTFWPDQPQ